MLTVLLVVYLFLPRASPGMCYQCASELALINWSRYGLPRSQGDSMMADDACLDEERLSAHVPCSAPCMTINITAIGGKHDGKVIGVVRDCQTYFRHPKTLPEGKDRICRHSERETVRNQRINVTFCYCSGQLCNRTPPPIHLRRSSLRRNSRLPGIGSTISSSAVAFVLILICLISS